MIKHAYACGSPIRQPYVKAASGGAEFHPEADPKYRGGDSIVWGKIRGAPRLIKEIVADGHDYYSMDNAYRIRDRYYRITKNADHHVGLEERPSDRWDELVRQYDLRIRNWTTGSHILIALSTQWQFKFHGDDIHQWLDNVVAAVKANTDRKIIIRTKPKKHEKVVPIEVALMNCHALITCMSMAALDAFQMGVPVFCDDKCAARPISRGIDELHRIEDPLYPENREQLFHTLAYHQFTKNELQSGMWKEYVCLDSS